MWITFVPDLIVTAVGALLTVAFAAAGFLIKVHLDRRAAVAFVLRELAMRRAFRAITHPKRVRIGENNEELGRISSSVRTFRDSVLRCQERVGAASRTHDVLNEMVRSCNRFLTDSRRDPGGFPIGIETLRIRLDELAQRLREIYRRMPAGLAGSNDR